MSRTATGLTIIVPLPPNLTNRGKGRSSHWRTVRNEQLAYWGELDALRLVGKIPPPPEQPWERVRARVTMFVHQKMDWSNAFARLKWVEDWLAGRKKHGVPRGEQYIVDDSPDHLIYEGLPDQVIDRKNPRIEILLTPDDWSTYDTGRLP